MKDKRWEYYLWLNLIYFDDLFVSHGQTNCSHHQINFSLIYVRISSQALVKWEQPREPSFQWSRAMSCGRKVQEVSPLKHVNSSPPPPPPLLLIQRCKYFNMSAFFLFIVQLEGQTPIISHRGGIFLAQEKKNKTKKNLFAANSLHKTVDSGPNAAASGGGATSIYCQVQVLKDNRVLTGMCMHWSAVFLTGFEWTHST